MIEFNLLPDTKSEYVKAERTKNLIGTVSLIISIISVLILALLVFYVDVAQKKAITNLTTNIQKNADKLNKNTNLNKILTIQNQAKVLPAIQLTLQEPTKIFDYLTQITPSKVSISNVSIDFAKNTLSLTGTTDSIETINKFVDTLNFTSYSMNNKSLGKVFDKVKLDSFTSAEGNSAFAISFSYSSVLFLQKSTINLSVPNITSTRSVVDQPADLFKQGN